MTATLVNIQRPARAPRAQLTFTIDGRAVTVDEGTTILAACRSIGIEIPTLCFLETLKPANVCRLCVVEVEGARVLAPSCSRAAEAGMVVHTRSPRVVHARRMVLELLASSVDLSTTPGMAELLAEYGCHPARYGPPKPQSAAGERDAALAGHHAPPDPDYAATVSQPLKVDNDLYVRDYSKCVLCYKCVSACGTDHQNSFAIAVAGRGFNARISTELAVPLPDSACVYCGNCIAVCPTGALMAKPEFDLRAAGAWRPEEQTATDTICPYCGVGCTLRLHVQDNVIVKATSPLEHGVTLGNLCVKGRFGWQFVQPSARVPLPAVAPRAVDIRPLGVDPGLGYGRPHAPRAIVRLDGGLSQGTHAEVAEEVPVAFIYGGRSHAVMMCTPLDFEDLAVGFTMSEGIVDRAADIHDVTVARHSRGVELTILVPSSAHERLAERTRTMSGRTGCGLCGVEAIEEAVRDIPPVQSDLRVSSDALWRAAAAIGALQVVNSATSAVHAAAWVTADGEIVVVREDVGRHNALDKVLGALWRSGTDASTGFLLLTSRLSYELVQKAAVAGVPVIAAISRPTGLAVRLAEGAGITLAGLVRGETANVYSHPHRLFTR